MRRHNIARSTYGFVDFKEGESHTIENSNASTATGASVTGHRCEVQVQQSFRSKEPQQTVLPSDRTSPTKQTATAKSLAISLTTAVVYKSVTLFHLISRMKNVGTEDMMTLIECAVNTNLQDLIEEAATAPAQSHLTTRSPWRRPSMVSLQSMSADVITRGATLLSAKSTRVSPTNSTQWTEWHSISTQCAASGCTSHEWLICLQYIATRYANTAAVQHMRPSIWSDFSKHAVMMLGHPYSFDIEKCAKELSGELDGPTNKCSNPIKTVAKWVFGKTINMTDLPSTSTVGNMLDRAQCLSKYQIAEGNGDSEMWDLHSDGTTRDGKKCVSTQVILDTDRSLSTSFKTVAVEDSSTLLDNDIAMIEEFCDMYDAIVKEVCRYVRTSQC